MGFCGKSIMYDYVVIFRRTEFSGLWGKTINRKTAFKYIKKNQICLLEATKKYIPRYDIYVSIPNKII